MKHRQVIPTNPRQPADLSDELPFWSAPFGLKLLGNVRYRKGITALDIGCGTGFPLTELAMRLGESCRVIGLDPWEAGLDRARRKIEGFGITQAELIAGVAEQIPLEDASVDLVVSNNGLNNVQDLSQVLHECARVLKPGGQFLQTVNLDGTMMAFYDVMEQVLNETGLEECIDTMRAHIRKKRLPLEAFLERIKEHGFFVGRVLHDEFHYTFVDGTSMLRHHGIRTDFAASWREIVPGDRRDKIFALIEARINQLAEEQGRFTLSVPFVVIDAVRNAG
jgi:SAM-dependent methyltransferase